MIRATVTLEIDGPAELVGHLYTHFDMVVGAANMKAERMRTSGVALDMNYAEYVEEEDEDDVPF